MAFFCRRPAHELQAATLCALLRQCGLLGQRAGALPAGASRKSRRFCDVYETFCILCPATVITFEHAWYLLQVLARLDEFVLARCPDCQALWIRDTLDLLPDNCAACRTGSPPD